MNSSKKILIVGGEDYIGQNLIKMFLESDYKVVTRDNFSEVIVTQLAASEF